MESLAEENDDGISFELLHKIENYNSSKIAEKSRRKSYPKEKLTAKSYLKDGKSEFDIESLNEKVKLSYQDILKKIEKTLRERIPKDYKDILLMLEDKLKKNIPRELFYSFKEVLLKGLSKGYLKKEDISGLSEWKILEYGPFVAWNTVGAKDKLYLFEPAYLDKLGFENKDMFERKNFYFNLLSSGSVILSGYIRDGKEYVREVYFFDPKEYKQKLEEYLKNLKDDP
ncbi:MAG: hypothetical protein QW040_02450 [Candidatus Aenigmatarchaeota archaeon]